MLWLFILPPKEGLFVVNFMPFTQGFDWIFVRYEIQSPGALPVVNARGGK